MDIINIEDVREEDLNPAYSNVAKVIGLEATLKLGKEFGGEHFYLPKLKGAQARMTLEEKEECLSRYWKYPDIAKVIGLEATLKLGKEFGGESFYLLKLNGTRGIFSRARERMIAEELKTYQGSIVHFARKWNITSRCIYNIIKRNHITQRKMEVNHVSH